VEHDFFRRVRRTSVITGLVIAWWVAVRWDLDAGVGWLLGCLWSLVNLYVIALVMRVTMSRERNRVRLLLVLAVKLPVLYGIGFFLLAIGRFPVIALLAGFTWPLLVITLKLLGRAVLRMDRRSNGGADLVVGKPQGQP